MIYDYDKKILISLRLDHVCVYGSAKLKKGLNNVMHCGSTNISGILPYGCDLH